MDDPCQMEMRSRARNDRIDKMASMALLVAALGLVLAGASVKVRMVQICQEMNQGAPDWYCWARR